MDNKTFNEVLSVGTLTWEQKNPIGYLYYPAQDEVNLETATKKKTQKVVRRKILARKKTRTKNGA